MAFRKSTWASAAAAILSAVLLLAFAAASYAQFGPVTDLGPGSQPHCALGLNGTLHIVYVTTGGVRYFTVTGGVPSAVETLPNSSPGQNPFVALGTNGSVHVVWHTYATAYYSNRIGGYWKNPVTLPSVATENNYLAQVAVDSNGVPFTSHWSLKEKGVEGYVVFSRVDNASSSTPTATKIRQYESLERPPAILGPNPASAGDGKLHIFAPSQQITHYIMDSNGNTSGEENISRTPPEKTVPGFQTFFVGTDKGIATSWRDNVDRGVVVNTLSRANSGSYGLIAGTGAPYYVYARGAYDPVGNKVYALYPKPDKPAIVSWVPTGTTVQQLGYVSEDTISNDTMGPGAGGIAPARGGGVHVVYSTGGRLYHRTVDAPADTQAPSVPTNVQASSPGSTVVQLSWTASVDNTGVAGYKVFRDGVQIDTTAETSYLDTGRSANTTYSYRVSAYDGFSNESAQSAQAVATTLAPDPIPPSVPTNVQASDVTGSSAKLTWNASTDNKLVLGYRIFRNSAEVATSTTTSYTDSGLSANTTYSYTVSAYDGDGNSSAQSSPPAIATTLNAVTISNLVPGGYMVATFDIGTQTFVDRTFYITDMPAQYCGLIGIQTANNDKDNPNLDFRFNINQTAVIYVCLRSDLTPSTPLLSAFQDTGDRISTTDTGDYKIWKKIYPAGVVNLGPKPGAGDGHSMYFVLVGLPEGPDTQPPSVPTNVVATPQAPTWINLTWTASTDDIAVAGYRIFRNGSEVGTSATTSYLDAGLSPATTYTYTVSAYDAVGNQSSQSAQAVATTPLTVVYQRFYSENFDTNPFETTWEAFESDCTTASPGSVVWYDAGGTGCGGLGQYVQRYSSGERCIVNQRPFNATGWDRIKLTYSYCVAASDGSASITPEVFRDGSWVPGITVTYPGSYRWITKSEVVGMSAASQVTNIRFRLSGSANVYRSVDCVYIDGIDVTVPTSTCSTATTITKDPLTDIIYDAADSGGSGVALVQLWYKKETGGTWTNTNIVGIGPSGTFDPWTPTAGDGTYFIRSRARDGAGFFENDLPAGGDASFVYDTTAPSIPNNVLAVAQTPSTIQITWAASNDNVSIAGYKIFRNGAEIGTSASTEYLDNGLLPDTTYTYTISAFDAADNNSPQSSPGAAAATMAAIGIAAAKELPNTTQVGLVDKVVTAIYDDSFYVEEVDRSSGIRVVPVQMPAGLSVGRAVDVGGIMQTSGNGERYIGDAVAVCNT